MYKKKTLHLLFSMVLLSGIVCACSNKHCVGSTGTTDKIEKTDSKKNSESISEETSAGTDESYVLSAGLTYTNLNSKSAIDEVKSILLKSGIKDEYVRDVLEWVADYNNCMKDCKEFTLIGDFTTVSTKAIDYGDYYNMSREWFRKNHRNYHDVLCRIVAFELNQDNITTKKIVKKDDFDCWDENKSWLYTDGDILFGREATEDDNGCVPFPLISLKDEVIAKYFTVFNPIFADKKCNEDEMLQVINKKWTEYGIEFKENPYSLITFWIQVDNEISVSHAGTLIETEPGYLFFEKTNPEEPYAATKFTTIDDLKSYLFEKLNLEYSKDGSEVGKYIILKNDKRI